VDTLRPGDVAKVYYEGDTYVYHFVRTIIVDPSNISVLRDNRADLTMTACHPPGYSTQRIVAQWKLVNVSAV
jgi:LPXTG-site transpeptidase (sortase) family protein